MFKVVILDQAHKTYEEEKSILADLPCELVISHSSDTEEILKICANADAIAVNLAKLDAAIISQLKNCKIIARYGVGYDNVDIDAASAKGIWVSNCQNYCNEETSDQAMALLLACVRRIAKRDRLLRQGFWTPAQEDAVFRIKGKVIGVIGFGGSGHAFVRKIRGFEPAQILIADPSEDPSHILQAGGIKSSFETVLSQADIISLHLPLKKETHHLFNRETLKRMKKNSILINTSRGGIINHDHLIEALQAGHPAFAGLDVFEVEPLSHPHPLKTLDNVVLSDHMGWYSLESFSELKSLVAKNIHAVLSGKPPLFPVNKVPE